jgi:hypothetical protein
MPRRVLSACDAAPTEAGPRPSDATPLTGAWPDGLVVLVGDSARQLTAESVAEGQHPITLVSGCLGRRRALGLCDPRQTRGPADDPRGPSVSVHVMKAAAPTP